MKTVVLINVGTPQNPTPEAVGVYLNEFLMDENIISIPRPFRDILVKGLIVPKRKFSSSEKYQKIWTKQGSPLMVESEALKNKLQNFLGSEWNVVLGMQIGKPALKDVIEQASGDEIYFCPLYPQFATATTGGALQLIQKKTKAKRQEVRILKPFYHESWFIDSVAAQIKKYLRPQDHLLLSYHGLPVSQLKSHRSACYRSENCCQVQQACAENCYKAQCLKTTDLLKTALEFSPGSSIQSSLDSSQKFSSGASEVCTGISTSFQSRLGRAQWIEPSTEDMVNQLLAQGVKHLKVACPSFVADCLETLEEIGLELKHQFLSGGGESFELIPCVNADDQFVEGLGRHLLGK